MTFEENEADREPLGKGGSFLLPIADCQLPICARCLVRPRNRNR